MLDSRLRAVPSSRCSRATLDEGRHDPRHQGGGDAAAQAPRRPDRAGQARRRRRARVGRDRGGRRLALARREVPLRRRDGRGCATQLGARRGRHAADRRRQAEGRRLACSASCAWRSRPRRSRATTCSGSWTSRCSSTTRTRSASTRCTTRSRRRRATSTATRQWRSDALRHRPQRHGDRRRLDPYQHARGAVEGVRRDRPRRGRGAGALRLPAGGAQVRRAAARRHRVRARPRSWRSWPATTRSAT